ncbi:MAG: tetratricopeptide repeat protein [Haliscomenobacteraceae bacterium CHB4]|nr:hypothetical protein [Saprospiraceae bacterium]MCE7924155.1 tetratricopeptide repeat protein [Haliscomenobacteraceae bacterium CHB4]
MQHEYLQQAEKYVRGLMTPQEREDFEAELLRNPELKVELRFQKAEKLVMETLGDQQLEQQMERWKKEKKTRERYLLTGLIAVLVLTCVVWWVMRNVSPPQDTIKAAPSAAPVASDTSSGQAPVLPAPQAGTSEPKQRNGAPSGLSPLPRFALALELSDPPSFDEFEKRNDASREDASVNQQLRDIESAYQQKNLEQAISLAQRLLQTDTGRSNRRKQLLGALYLQNRDLEAAIRVLESIPAPFKEGGEWNLLLCYFALPEQHTRDFTVLYEKISRDNEHPAHDKLLKNKKLFDSK